MSRRRATSASGTTPSSKKKSGPASPPEPLIEAPLGLRLALSLIEDHPGPAYAHRRANIAYTAATRLLRALADSDAGDDGDPWVTIGNEIDRTTARMYSKDDTHADFVSSAALLMGFALCWITMAHATGQPSGSVVGGAR
ncbi:MAG: hypothetical protein ABJA98_17545 [Acidobacteriota bacterium]